MAKNKLVNSRNFRRRFKIVSKTRFCIFLASVWLLICPVISLAMDYQKNQVHKSYIKVYVEKGDTLWDIAKRTLPENTDIRNYIQDIKKANQMDSALIKEGDVLKIPIY